MIRAAILSMILFTPPQSSGVDGTPLDVIPKQALPKAGCAAYLWSAAGSRALVAMATADPASLRLSIGGKVTDLPRTAQHDADGVGGFGFSAVTEYQAGEVRAVLDLTITPQAALKDGAAIPQATLRIDRTGRDSAVLPVAGLIGCV